MTGKEMFLTLSTFFMGVFAGTYLYIIAFAPAVQGILPDGKADADSFLIEGQMYGSCEEDGICASFQLLEGREYSYLPYDDAPIEHGTLPGAYSRLLRTAFTPETLAQFEKRSGASYCQSDQGGNDYMYVVTLERTEYVLDTCTTLFASAEDEQELLFNVWYAFENEDAPVPDAPTFDFKIEDAANILFDRFHNGQ